MSLLHQLGQRKTWERFLIYKEGQTMNRVFAGELRQFIEEEAYLPVYEAVLANAPFPLPVRSVINKMSTKKRRVVYTYPPAENMVLKLLTWLLIREYDGIFGKNLWSFRPGRGAKDAIRFLTRTPGIGRMYAYKADISNYFNSVDVSLLLPELAEVTADDPDLYRFLHMLLTEEHVLDRGKIIVEQKGIMAGTPLASFYANLYLRGLDRHFAETDVLYARYSDDLILFAETPEKLEEHIRYVRGFLEERRLAMNSDKEIITAPGERWEFLGFSFENGVIDIAEPSGKKLMQKMRRKTRALRRWQMKKGLPGEKAAKAFIRAFNRKLFEETEEHDLTWARWYFPVIGTTGTLEVIDHYAQDCIRYLAAGTRTKSRYNVRYEDMKAWGYRSLVHEYYRKEDGGQTEKEPA